MRRIAALLFASLMTACASGGGSRDYTPGAAPRTVWIVGGSGAAIGQATFTDGPNGVLIRMEFSAGALPPGWHGLHIHQHGDCSDFAAGFQASGSHEQMEHHGEHGLLNPDGPEAGDLPNIFAAPSGPFAVEVFSPYLTLGSERIPGNANRQAREPLLDNDGAALLIHAAADDHASQPIGNAGARIGCAALTRLP